MKLLDMYTHYKKDIDYIERQLERVVRTDHLTLNQTALHLLKAGGKRIRPIIVLLAGQFGTYSLERLQHVAVALELIHMASLVHDDVIDDAQTRRGELTVKSKWDNRIAMYTGDYIFAKALTYATELENPLIHSILSKAIVQMSIGEMEQIRYFFCPDQSIRTYLLRIRRKTALLIAISCQLGAVAAGCDKTTSRKLYAFGYNVGMAFQIRDDILDLTGTEKQLGKPPGSDLRQGNITLPVLCAMREPVIRRTVESVLSSIQAGDTAQEMPAVLDMLKNSDGLKEAERLAAKYIDKANAELTGLPDIPAKRHLTDLAYFVGARSH